MKRKIMLSIMLLLCIPWVSNILWAMESDPMEVESGDEPMEESSNEGSIDEEEILRREVGFGVYKIVERSMLAEIRRLKETCRISMLDRKFIRAIEKNDRKRVRELREAGASVSVKKYRVHFYEQEDVSEPGLKLVFSPIHWVVANNHLEMAALLLELGANIAESAYPFLPPLHQAVQDSNLMVQTLLFSPYGVPGVRKAKWDTMRTRLQELLYGITYARRGKAPIPREIRPLICRFALQVDGPPNGPVNGPLIERFPLQFLRYLCGYNLVDRDQIVTAFTQRHLGILSQAFSGRIHHRAVGEIEPLADGVNRTLFDPDPARIRAHFGEKIEGAYRSFLTTFTQNESNN